MTGCGSPTQALSPTQGSPTELQPSETSQPTLQQTPTAVASERTTLTICTRALPENLLPYNESFSANKSNLLAMIYEEPFLVVDGVLTPVILEKVPAQVDGDLVITPVSVQAGQSVAAANGQVKILKPGLQVRPGGCRSNDCVITWDGETPLEMDQMVVDYKIKGDLTWSDGAPVTAEDSILSYKTAADWKGAGSNWTIERTEGYLALNQKDVQWRGIPGFTTADLSEFFWKPLPAHLYQDFLSQGDLESDEGIRLLQVGYGPFIAATREDQQLLLSRNPNYFRDDNDLPKFDQVLIREVVGGLGDAWLDLQNGDCDVLDSTFSLAESQDLLAEIQSNPEFDVVLQTGESWSQLVFGIKPSSHDDFYNPELGDRPDYLGDARTRQAIMHCLNREGMRQSILGELGEVWPDYLPPEISKLGPGEGIDYDPTKGVELLQSVGWYDLDGDPSTPFQSWYAPNVPGGAPLSLELLVSPNPFHQAIAEGIKIDLAECGVGLTVRTLPAESLYAPGPSGPLFGRQFDLALISWQPMPGGDCQFYQSWNVPSDENFWIGTNIAGLLNEDYDRACADAVLALPGEKDEAIYQSELSYLNHLPAVPLFSIPKVIVIPTSGCSEKDIKSEGQFFANIAYFGLDQMCP